MWQDVLFQQVFPVMGTFFYITVSLSSFFCAIECRRRKSLDPIDPFSFIQRDVCEGQAKARAERADPALPQQVAEKVARQDLF